MGGRKRRCLEAARPRLQTVEEISKAQEEAARRQGRIVLCGQKSKWLSSRHLNFSKKLRKHPKNQTMLKGLKKEDKQAVEDARRMEEASQVQEGRERFVLISKYNLGRSTREQTPELLAQEQARELVVQDEARQFYELLERIEITEEVICFLERLMKNSKGLNWTG